MFFNNVSMNKQEFLSILTENAEDTNVIRGIFNWCDRWCEKCTKTEFCTVYRTSVRLPSDTPEEFFNSLTLLFEATMEMLNEYFKDIDVDIDSLDDTDFIAEFIKEKEIIQNDTGINLAKQYGKQVKQWLDSLKKKNAYSMEVRMQDEMLADCLEVIHWYQYLFEMKMSKALLAKKIEEEESLNPFDSLGNAKLLLVSIERNIAAWGYLYQKFKEDEDEILDILVSLQRLCKLIEQVFPEARAFIRTGLDG